MMRRSLKYLSSPKVKNGENLLKIMKRRNWKNEISEVEIEFFEESDMRREFESGWSVEVRRKGFESGCGGFRDQKRGYSSVVVAPKKSLSTFSEKYRTGVPLVMVTAYDYTSGVLAEEADVDAILVGDSLGMVIKGDSDTTQVSIDEMIYHCKSVRKGAPGSFIVGDMTFGSYEISDIDAVTNAIRLVKEGGVNAIKLEGGKKYQKKISAIVEAGIPVMGHIGLTPQTINSLGGFVTQGKTADAASYLVDDALALQESGCFALVIESVPQRISDFITRKLSIPTIGIGAGKFTSGQILVWHDMLGLYSKFTPKFTKKYSDLKSNIKNALAQYKTEVESRSFPAKENSFLIKSLEWKKFKEMYNIPDDEVEQDNITRKKDKKKIAIIGAGGMGSLVGARVGYNNDNDISPYETDVWLISNWSDHVETINANGLTLEEMNGDKKILKNVRATSNPEEAIQDGPADLVFVLVKSPFTHDAVAKARILLGDRPFERDHQSVITMQNGIGNLEIIHSELSKHTVNSREPRLILGVTNQGAMITSPGVVRHTGDGISTIHGNPAHQHVKLTSEILNKGNFKLDVSQNLESIIWGKLIINAAINPITALLQLTNGELAKSREAEEIVKKVIAEAVQVAHARGIELPYEDAYAMTLSVLNNTASNQSSMFKDYLRGVKTEVDWINGVIVREGEKLGVDVDTNRQLVSLLEKPGSRAEFLTKLINTSNTSNFKYL